MSKIPDHPAKPTYFGMAALVAGVLCLLSLLSNYGASQLNIAQETFAQLNNLTALFYCVSTQSALALGILGLTRKNDSKRLAWAGIALAVIPFLFVFGGLLISFL
jgi:hypothetical protein